MAAGKDDCLQSVREFLDKEFGENLDELGDLRHVIERKQHYEDILKNEISHCVQNAKVCKEKAKDIGTEQVKEIGRLLDEKSKTEHETNHYLLKNNEIIGELKQLNQDIEEVNCVQVYLSWLTQIIHLSSELKNEVLSGHLEIAVEYFNNISDIAKQTSASKCDNLVDYLLTLRDYWFKALSDILIRAVNGLLEKMKWPFSTGISSPMINEKNDQEILSKFASLVRLVLNINPHQDVTDGLSRCLMLTEILARPLQKRFSFHFYGTRRTNNLEKPEWYFTQILNWIRDHSPFLETYIQPIVDKEGFQGHYIQHEFIKLLVQTATEKVKSSLPHVMTNEALFSHMVDEIILFDNELRTMFDYPSNFSGCTIVIMAQPFLSHWIYLEEKRGVEAIDQLLSQNDAFTSKFDDFGAISSSKVPYSVENAIVLISLITEKYRGFNDIEAQLKFIDLQLHLLAYLAGRLQELASLESTLFDRKVLFAVLNGCQFIEDVLNEWSEEVFFIKLHCLKSQMASKEFSNSVHAGSARLDDSITDDYSDISVDIVSEPPNSFLECGLFDHVTCSINKLSTSLMEKVLKSLEKDFVKKLTPYKNERWHCMPSSKDVIKYMLPSSGCSLLMAVKETLHVMHYELCSTTFAKLWQKYIKMADWQIFNELILASHFNEGGAGQLRFDMTKNLFVLFEEYTPKPESYFKLTKESCILLNLLPGSAVLLREVLLVSSKESEKKQHSLLEIGVKNISPEDALIVLNSRIDWPQM